MKRARTLAAKIIGLLFAALALPSAAEQPTAAATPGVESTAPALEQLEESQAEDTPALLVERADLLQQVEELLAKLDGLTEQLEGTTGEEHLVLLGQIGRVEVDVLKLYDALADNATESRTAGLDAAELDAFFAREFVLATGYLSELIGSSQKEVLEFARAREQQPRSELIQYEERLAEYNKRIDHYYEVLLEHAARLDRVELDGAEARAYFQTELPIRADRISGRVALARAQIRTLEERLRESPGDSEAEIELRAARVKLAWTIASLTEGARLLDTVGIPTSEYRRLLIRATGSLTQDIFDVEVAKGLIDETMDDAREWAKVNGATVAFRIVFFILILAVFRGLGSFTRRVVVRALKASRLRTSVVLQEMLGALAGRAVLLIGILFGFSQLGVEVGPLLAGIGIIGFAVGFALQETLSNFASGTMLLVYRPFDAGDVIDTGGVLGKVDHLSLVNTTLLTFDNRKIVIPNNKIWGNVITNITSMDTRRVDLEVGVAHSEKVARIEALLGEVVHAHPKVLQNPEAMIKVHKLGESSIDFIVRPWTRREDYWNVYWDLTRAIKLRFEEEGVELARPRRLVVVEPQDGTS